MIILTNEFGSMLGSVTSFVSIRDLLPAVLLLPVAGCVRPFDAESGIRKLSVITQFYSWCSDLCLLDSLSSIFRVQCVCLEGWSSVE